MPSKRLASASPRQQIIAYLAAHGTATAAELATTLGVTAAAARHHLRLLRSEGLVVVVPGTATTGRGRPARRYRLSPEALAPHLLPLTRALLDLLRAAPPHHALPLEALSEYLCADCPPPAHGSLRLRLQRAMPCLEACGFSPRWEAHHHGPRVLFRRCPYAALVEDYPELCELDTVLLEHLLAAPVRKIPAARPCMFEVLTDRTHP